MKLADQIYAIMEENYNLTDEQLGQAVDIPGFLTPVRLFLLRP